MSSEYKSMLLDLKQKAETMAREYASVARAGIPSARMNFRTMMRERRNIKACLKGIQ